MIEIVLNLAPFLLIFLTAIVALGFGKKFEDNRNFGFMGLLMSLLFNSFLLFYQTAPVYMGSLHIHSASLWLNEIFLFFGLLIYISLLNNLKQSHNSELIAPSYLIIIGAMYGLNLTSNLLVITTFYFIFSISIAIIFNFGPYRKKFSHLQGYLLMLFIVFVILIITNLIIYYTYQSLDLEVLASVVSDSVSGINVTVLILLILGFSLLCGIFPVFHIYLKNILAEANPLLLRILVILFYPITIITLIRVINPFSKAIFSSQLLFALGLIGSCISVVILLFELFGKFKEQSRSIPKIIGYLAILELNISILLISLFGLSGFSGIVVFRYILLYLILVMSVKFLLIEGLSPIFAIADEWDLRHLGGYNRFFFNNVILILLIPTIYAVPGLLGYHLNIFFLDAISTPLPNEPIMNMQIWVVFNAVLVLQIIWSVIIAIILLDVYFGKSRTKSREVIPKLGSNLYTGAILIFLTILFVCIFVYVLPDFFNSLFSDLYNNFLFPTS